MAKWILRENYPSYYKEYFCDNCKTFAHQLTIDNKTYGVILYAKKVPLLTPYCPYCGEKMENPTFLN